MDDMVHQSNLYAEQLMGVEKYREWEKITTTELRAYLGFAILMGMVHLPAVEDYWKLDPFLHYAPIADRVSRNRFREITRYLHFTDNTQLPSRDQPGYDRLGKVRPVIEHFQQVFLTCFDPHCEQAIDEAMIPFQGRSTLKQYLPMKPVKRGIKVWVRADSHNGYFSQFEVYTGKGSVISPELGLGGSVVKQLTRPLVGKYPHIFCDNFFTSANLFANLLLDDIYACGTVRTNRKGFPDEFKDKKRVNQELKNRCAFVCTCCVHVLMSVYVRECVCVCAYVCCMGVENAYIISVGLVEVYKGNTIDYPVYIHLL